MAHANSSTAALHCLVVTPEATVIDTSAEFVALPLYDGEAGIAPGRSPLIGRLGYGELRIRRAADSTIHMYVDGGFVQVVDNVVSVLTNRAIPAISIDPATAAEQLRSALASRAAGRQELAIRDRLVAQARGQMRVANRTRATTTLS
ncbi:MAG TPA: ATP synthase F1 subunit epsilon [Lacipirellulaceae bacterium]